MFLSTCKNKEPIANKFQILLIFIKLRQGANGKVFGRGFSLFSFDKTPEIEIKIMQ